MHTTLLRGVSIDVLVTNVLYSYYHSRTRYRNREYHEFIAGYCYKCAARVTIPEAMNE